MTCKSLGVGKHHRHQLGGQAAEQVLQVLETSESAHFLLPLSRLGADSASTPDLEQIQRALQTWSRFGKHSRLGADSASTPDLEQIQRALQTWSRFSKHSRLGADSASTPADLVQTGHNTRKKPNTKEQRQNHDHAPLRWVPVERQLIAAQLPWTRVGTRRQLHAIPLRRLLFLA
jgi:hypothetical protein